MDVDGMLRKMLREEYGINTGRELDEAVRKMPRIDIALFCVERTAEGKTDDIINTGTSGADVFGSRAHVLAGRGGNTVSYNGDETVKPA